MFSASVEISKHLFVQNILRPPGWGRKTFQSVTLAVSPHVTLMRINCSKHENISKLEAFPPSASSSCSFAWKWNVFTRSNGWASAQLFPPPPSRAPTVFFLSLISDLQKATTLLCARKINGRCYEKLPLGRLHMRVVYHYESYESSIDARADEKLILIFFVTQNCLRNVRLAKA